MSSQWNIWVIKQEKFDAIKYFLETEMPEVEEVFFPTILKEFRSARKHHKRRVPLYSGYLFLKYDNSDNSIYHKLKSNPFVSNYVGVCSESSVGRMREKEEWNALSNYVEVGDKVEVMCGPFKGCKGFVDYISGNKVTMKVKLFDREIDYTLSSEDLEIIGR